MIGTALGLSAGTGMGRRTPPYDTTAGAQWH